MIGLLKYIYRRAQTTLFPTKAVKEANRYWKDGGYEKFSFDFDLNENSLVMDLGGYKGQWASDIYARYNCHVLVFEPVKGFAERITEKFKKNPKVKVFCLALGASRRRDVLFLCEDGSSVFRKSGQKETIQFEDVVDFFRQENIEQVDLMQINIEGGEYDLLEHLIKTGLVKYIKNIQIQFHDFMPNAEQRMTNIQAQLSKTHELTYQYMFVWENWRIKVNC